MAKIQKRNSVYGRTYLNLIDKLPKQGTIHSRVPISYRKEVGRTYPQHFDISREKKKDRLGQHLIALALGIHFAHY